MMMKLKKRNSGVTLLEIMLVLAIAAMVIVMSIRFYRNASNSQSANSVLDAVNAVTAAADNMAQGTNSYSAITTTSLSAVVGTANMRTPFGGITISTPGQTSYTVTLAGIPPAICNQIKSQLAGNMKITGLSSNTCASTGNFVYTYDSTK